MLFIWAGLALLAMVVSHRLRFAPLLFVASSALPWIVFYGITICDCWSSMAFAVTYSRGANAWAAINLAAMLVTVYKGRANGLD